MIRNIIIGQKYFSGRKHYQSMERRVKKNNIMHETKQYKDTFYIEYLASFICSFNKDEGVKSYNVI